MHVEFIVKSQDGRIAEKDSYGNDPRTCPADPDDPVPGLPVRGVRSEAYQQRGGAGSLDQSNFRLVPRSDAARRFAVKPSPSGAAEVRVGPVHQARLLVRPGP